MALARQEYTLPARLFVPKASSERITLCLVRSFFSQKLDHTPLFCQDLSCVTSGGTWRARGKRSHQHTLICFREARSRDENLASSLPCARSSSRSRGWTSFYAPREARSDSCAGAGGQRCRILKSRAYPPNVIWTVTTL